MRNFIEVVGLLYILHSNNYGKFKDGIFKRLLRNFDIFQAFTEPRSPWQFWAEPDIGDIKRQAQKIIQAYNTPV